MIIADAGGPKPEIRLAFGFLVAVKEDLFAGFCLVIPILAASDGVLTASAEPDVVGVRTVFGRRGLVVFLDPALDLGKQRFLKVRCRSKHGFGVVVFSIEIGFDLRIQLGRVSHDFHPVVHPQPAVIIMARIAMMGFAAGHFFGARRGGGFAEVKHAAGWLHLKGDRE